MASKTGAYAAVLAGGLLTYSAFTHKRVIDVLLMRQSTLPKDTSQTNVSTYANIPNAANLSSPVQSTPLRNAVCAVAQQATMMPVGWFEYDEIRPYPPHLLTGPPPKKTDCSGFAILCYKDGGAPDPSGLGYSGAGATGALIARGRHTTTPQPADLAFWSSPDHVAVYIGGGQVIEFGGGTAPIETSVETENGYHASFLGYRSYLPTQ